MSEATAVASTAPLGPMERAGRGAIRPPPRSNAVYWAVLYGIAGVFVVVCGAFLYSTIANSLPAWRHSGLSLLYGLTWDPQTKQYGALPLIVGTLETSAIALLFAVPLGVFVAIAIVHLVPRSLRVPLSSLVELLAAVPSVLYGIIGVVLLTPWFQSTLDPWLQSSTHDFVLFSGVFSGYSTLTAGVVLFVMVLPTVVALSRDAIAIVPTEQLEGALSLGATKWQTIRRVALPAARTGITGAVTLAAARALGETIAVTMVIGGSFKISKSLVQGGNTLAATIVSSWDGATALTVANLFALGVILIAIAASVNGLGRYLLRRAQVQESVIAQPIVAVTA